MGDVIVTASGKGGTGKSTVAAALASSLAMRGSRVLLIDTDKGLRSVDYMFGVSENIVFDLWDIVMGNCETVKAIINVGKPERLDIIPAPMDIQAQIKGEDIRKFTRGLLKYYDYIILDAPAGFGADFDEIASAATMAVVVTTPDPISVRDVENMSAHLKQFKNVKSTRLIINRLKKIHTKLNLVQNFDDIIDKTGLRLLGVIPEDDYLCAAAYKGEIGKLKFKTAKHFDAVAARIEGKNVPLLITKL